MGESKDERELQRPSAAAEAGQAYEETRGILLRLFTRKFGISPEDAEKLVYETFLAYQWLEHPRPEATAWLIGAACSRAMTYRRSQGLPDLAPSPAAALDFARTLRYEQALDTLSPRAREALRLHAEHGMTYAEVAAELGISTFAAKRIVTRAAMKVRKRAGEG
ncbi:MAG TPA: sigma-70 family RNA polymerase sigma factor [Thermoanaerobaculia bacterium]|nr:sigma-70 family RNA polymerase sigma factor [Thermoanaerobaculia bacterium]